MKCSPTPPISSQLAALVGWLALSFATAAIGAVASANAGDFYAELTRPEWAPPAWLFGPVWTVVYALMGVSAWLVWRTCGFARSGHAYVVFVTQLSANALWSWVFFNWHQGAMAFVEIMILWGLIAATIVAFWRLHMTAALLLLPYLAWVTFAAVLNFSLWQLNPGLL
jgi:translocator protein